MQVYSNQVCKMKLSDSEEEFITLFNLTSLCSLALVAKLLHSAVWCEYAARAASSWASLVFDIKGDKVNYNLPFILIANLNLIRLN